MRLTERVLLLTMAAVTFAAAQDDPPSRVGRLNLIDGTVSFQPAGVEDWVPADLNRPLTTGDHLWVESDSRAEMHIGASALRLSPRTAFQFLNLDDRTVQIRLSEGTLIVSLRELDEDQVFEVDTPNLAFSLLRPGVYRIDANPDNETTTLTVRGGEGEVTSGNQAFAIKRDQMARVTGDQSVTYELLSAQSPDYFEEWAMSRDRREDSSESARYVSRDVVGYEDLDVNGDWRPIADYGTVWVPRRVPPGWAPYRFGHWAWIEPWGWTWVDAAPWGFAPFHYGRWAFVTGTWCWVPGPIAVRPVYAPALVAWVGGPRFNLSVSIGGGGGIGWFPLGPREVYVPAYRASRTYVTRVNTTNTTINNINVTNIYNNSTNVRYVNQTAPNAVTAVPREVLLHARPVSQAAVPVQAQAIENAQVIRTAEVAPSRESVLGRQAGAAGTAPRPPASVINRSVVAKATPPPAPIAFERRQQALAADPGHPLDPSTLSRMRAEQPTAVRPLVRQVDRATVNGGRPQNNPAAGNAPVYRPNPASQETPQQQASPNRRFENNSTPAERSVQPYNPERQQRRTEGSQQEYRPPARPSVQQPREQAAPPERRMEATPPRVERPAREPNPERQVERQQQREQKREERAQPADRKEKESKPEKEEKKEDAGRRRPG